MRSKSAAQPKDPYHLFCSRQLQGVLLAERFIESSTALLPAARDLPPATFATSSHAPPRAIIAGYSRLGTGHRQLFLSCALVVEIPAPECTKSLLPSLVSMQNIHAFTA